MPVEYAASERIATITLNRPEAMNSLDPESLVELNDAFQRANAEQDVRVVILTGAGDKAFCTGSDLKKTMPPKESFAELTFGERGHVGRNAVDNQIGMQRATFQLVHCECVTLHPGAWICP